MIFLQDVVHFCDVLAGHGFDDKAMVVAGQKAIPKAALGVAVERGAPRQGVLEVGNRKDGQASFKAAPSSPGNFAHVCWASRQRHLVVLVVNAEPLPQVSEHHGTVLFELKATRQVFSENNSRDTVRPHWSLH